MIVDEMCCGMHREYMCTLFVGVTEGKRVAGKLMCTQANFLARIYLAKAEVAVNTRHSQYQ
jgi:hypothetical protein